MMRGVLTAICVLALGLATAAWQPSLADDLPAPRGPVVLIVAGNIAAVNRGPYDPLLDPFLAYHEKSFEAAAEFDRAMLEGLGLHEVELTYEGWPETTRFAGPRLADLLGFVGARGNALTVTALDGFAVDITAEELAERDWIVALERDGRPLGIGGRGPLWIVYGVTGSVASHDDEARWPWAVFYIEVH